MRKRNPHNYIGKRFGRLTVIGESVLQDQHTKVNCKCSCGKIVTIILSDLITLRRVSCGCAKNGVPIHGLSGTPEYQAWLDARERCTKPNHQMYKWYGGRGIKMCQDWLLNYPKFLAHIGSRPSSDYSLDRINNNGHYEPGNVRWATRVQQQENKRNGNMFCNSNTQEH